MKSFSHFIVLLFIVVGLTGCPGGGTDRPAGAGGLNRHPFRVHYSKHALCRMQCRHIDENEVLDIIHNGTINYGKSNLDGDDCHKRYALEGYEKNERLRIIVASCGNVDNIITCIDLDTEFDCDCPGDQHHY
jgi:hypothetical protein